MKYQLSHTTTFRYSDPVPLGHNKAHLTPRSFWRQECLISRLDIAPNPATVQRWSDYFGNQVTFFTIEDEHRELMVKAISQVEVFAPYTPSPEETPPWENVLATFDVPADADTLAASQFTFDSPYVRRHRDLAEYAAVSFTPGRPLLAAALDLTERIFREFKFDPTATCVNTPTSEVFQKKRGVCQDFAHLQVACLRSLGLAARYVSGYLLTDPPPGKPRLIGADASHAWLSVFCPGTGWLDFDPTNNQMPSLRHVTLGWGRDYGDICPINGLFLGGGRHVMTVAVDVVPYPEDGGKAAEHPTLNSGR